MVIVFLVVNSFMMSKQVELVFNYVRAIIEIATAVLAIIIVQQLNERQEEKHFEMHSASPKRVGEA